MMVYVVVSGHMLGGTDAAYLHGVFTSEEAAREVAARLYCAEVNPCELNQVLPGDPAEDYHQLPGVRLI